MKTVLFFLFLPCFLKAQSSYDRRQDTKINISTTKDYSQDTAATALKKRVTMLEIAVVTQAAQIKALYVRLDTINEQIKRVNKVFMLHMDSAFFEVTRNADGSYNISVKQSQLRKIKPEPVFGVDWLFGTYPARQE